MGIKSSTLPERVQRQIAEQDARQPAWEPPIKWEMTLPYPPTVNHYYGYGKSKVYTKPDGKAYRAIVVSMVARTGVRPMSGPLKIWIDVHFPDHRKRDLDNLLKCLLDALTHGGVYADDSLLEEIRIRKAGYSTGGKVVVTVEALK